MKLIFLSLVLLIMKIRIRVVVSSILFFEALTNLLGVANLLHFQVGIMMFLGYFLTYIARYNLSVHILDMTRVTSLDILNQKHVNTTIITRSGEARQGVGRLFLL